MDSTLNNLPEGQFKKNAALFAIDNPKAAELLLNLNPTSYQLLANQGGELTLKKGDFFLCSPIDAIAEAQEWFSQLDLTNIQVLYVFGIGLGYYYEAASSWLHQNKSRRLIFLEDDLSVIFRFLETRQCEVILQDPQVRLLYFEEIDADWQVFYWLVWSYLFEESLISALDAYARERQALFSLIQRKMAFEQTDKKARALEDLEYGAILFNNYYRNLFELPYAYLGSRLFGKFNKIPAIICGAGPSLNGHLPFLQSLQNRALIFAAGSAMNALNHHGILPHFGVTLDPYSEQFQRLTMNQAYEVPYFYSNRAMYEAVKLLHGPRLLISGSGAYHTAEWMDKKLHIPNEVTVEEGYSVTTFALSLAYAMGCDPIIFVGVDLSDKKGQHYPIGIKKHPLYWDSEPQDPGARLIMEDIFGETVYTSWRCVVEANWISFFSESHPDTQIINATEGGIGMFKVPNMPLKEVEKRFLTRSFDLRGLVHGTIQQAAMPMPINSQSIIATLLEFYQSLQRCAVYCQKKVPEEDFKDEPAYHYFLKDLSEFYVAYQHKDVVEVERLTKQHQADQAKQLEQSIMQRKFAFLYDAATAHCRIIQNTLKEASEVGFREQPLINLPTIEGDLVIQQAFLEGKLEGESIVESMKGQVLSDTLFKDGLRQGDANEFYSNGNSYGKLHYQYDQFEGKQEYYYLSGHLKTELTYHDGLLDGPVKLYYPDGKLKMELSFQKGVRHGFERRWYENGQLFIELEYQNGRPVHVGRCWLSDGKLAYEKPF